MDEVINDLEKVQVILYLDFSEESEKALEIAWDVAETLLDNNIWVEVEPIHLWIHDPLGVEIYDYPKIIINGRVMFIGRSPTKRELIDAILDRIGKPYMKKKLGEPFFSKKFSDGFREIALIY